MDKDSKSFFRRKWFLRLTSLVLAIFLFMYVNGSKSGFLRQNTRNNNQTSALMSNKSATIKMPLDVTVDNSKYIVSGYPQYVKVKVNGPSALVTTTTNTQNFKVYADLSDLGPGKHQVKLKTTGLNSELKSTIEPTSITVNVQPRKTITMRVTIRLSNKSLDSGYQLGHPRSDIQNVQVTGAREQVNRVDRIVAFVAVPRDAKNNISRQVTLQAIDKNGQTLNVVISPTTTNVEIPVVSGDSSSSSTSDSNGDAKEGNSNRTRSSSATSTQASQASNSSSAVKEDNTSASDINQ